MSNYCFNSVSSFCTSVLKTGVPHMLPSDIGLESFHENETMYMLSSFQDFTPQKFPNSAL